MRQLAMVLKRLIPFILFPMFSNASTSSVHYGIPAAVELRGKENSTCSGTIVGDAPLKVLTAEHCLSEIITGGVQILDPTAKVQRGQSRWIKSSKVYLSKNADFKLIVDEKYSLIAQISELDLVINAGARKLRGVANDLQSPRTLWGALFAPPPQLSEEESKKLGKLLIDSTMARGRLQEKLDIAEDTLNSRFTDHDLAVLIFDVKLPGGLSLEQRVKNREIIPLARKASREQNIPVVMGGFGLTRQNQRSFVFAPSMTPGFIPPRSSHFTTNTVSVNPKRNTVYSLFGNVDVNLKKLKAPLGTLGAPLPGDSGSALLSDEGILAVTASISFYSSHVPPAPNWINSVEDTSEIVERYDYIMAHFPSVTSPIAQALFAEVEAKSGALVYADQVKDYAGVFESEKLAILEVGKQQEMYKLFRVSDTTIIASEGP